MAKARGIRRFLRFSLRSLLLVTLAVAAWLGYEVRQARTVERQAAAIRALGGEVEFEPSPWSLLRCFEPQTYGQQIVAVRIPPSGGEDFAVLLRGLAHLRLVVLDRDGTADSQLLRQAIDTVGRDVMILTEVIPIDSSSSDSARWEKRRSAAAQKRYERFADKIERADERANSSARTALEYLASNRGPYWVLPDRYDLLQLPSGSFAELLVTCIWRPNDTYQVTTVLLVDDRFIDARNIVGLPAGVDVVIKDVDGDKMPELGFEVTSRAGAFERMIASAIPGDPRLWLGLYAVESSGLRSLLPEDQFKE